MAKSKIQAAPATAVEEKRTPKVHTLPRKTEPKAETPKVEPGADAKGFSLAQSAIAEVRGHGQTWLTYAARLMVLEPAARKAFREAISAHFRALGKAAKGDEKKLTDAQSATLRSAKVRLSELSTLSQAMDGGFEPESDGVDAKGLPKLTQPFFAIIANARAFKDAEAAKNGEGKESRGRTPDSMATACIKYVLKRETRGNDDVIERKQILEMLKKAYPEAYALAQGDKPESGDPADGILKNAA